MSQKEIVTVLKVNTENSGNNIKSLKQEIAQLKKTLESAEIGSEEFAKASRDLAIAQANLKTVMADGKRAVDAADGSYNHLVATMAELKKQWKATADEAKRNEIGKQIDEINTKLKDMDATIGNHQRNVGNYKGDIIEAFDEMGGGVKSYGERWSEMQKSTEQTRAKFESVQKVASGVASGFAALQGVTALLGIENENLEKTLVKVQAAMAIAQGIGGMKDLIEGFTQGKTAFAGATMGLQSFKAEAVATQSTMAGTTVATNASTVAVKGFRKALISTGIGAILVGIGVAIAAIVENWDKLTKALGINKKEQKEVNKAIEESIEREKERKREVNTSVGSIIGKYKLLQRQWKELSSVEEKNEWINKNRDAFNDLGIAISNVTDAQRVFIEYSDEVIKAIKDQAKARAMAKLYEDAIARQYTAQQELDDAKKTAEQKYYSGYNPTDEEAENAGLNDYDYESGVIEENSLFEQWVLGQDKYEYNSTSENVDYGGARKLQDVYTRPFQQNVDAINGEVAKIEEAFVEAEQTAAESAAAVQKLGIDYTPTGGSSGGSSGGGSDVVDADLERIKEIQERVEKYLEETRKSLIDTREEELAEQQLIFEEEKKFLENKGIDTANLVEENRQKVAEINKKWDDKEKAEREKAANDLMSSLNDELDDISYNSSINSDTVEIGYTAKSINLDENDAVGAIQLEIDKTLELQGIRERAFEEQMAQIKAVLDAEKERDLLTAEQEAELQKQYDTLQQEKVLATAEATNQINALNKQMIEQQKADNRELAQNITTTFTTTLNSVSSILSAVQEGIDTTDKEGFEKNKKLQIANATIQAIVGITTALAGAYTTKTGPWDIPLAYAQAATIAATTGIQIANIKKQTFDGANSDIGNLNGGVGVSPNISMADMIPINYTKDVLTDTETAELNKGNRVYVVESDITETQNDVAVKETNSSF